MKMYALRVVCNGREYAIQTYSLPAPGEVMHMLGLGEATVERVEGKTVWVRVQGKGSGVGH